MEALHSLEAFLKARPLLSAAGTLALGIGIIAYRDYRSYVALGPHGMPDTLWGWYKQLEMTRMSRKDTMIPAPYDLDKVAGLHDRTSYLPQSQPEALRRRPGNKPPQIPGFVVPQRQVTEQANSATKEVMFGYLDALVAANPKVLQMQLSVLEGPVPAMVMRQFGSMPDSSKPKVLRQTQGEMCHIHPIDGSTHLMLSLVDQKRVIELGWGRRHRLSGGGMVPWNYTLIYAPRNKDEIVVWKKIVNSTASFCCADVSEIQAP